MGEKKRALLYLGKYFAIPDGVEFDDFVSQAEEQSVETYRYIGLTPPEFVEDSTQNVLLKIDYPHLALETEITLIDRNYRKERISMLCPKNCGLCSKKEECKKFGYEKMSVNGTCFYGDCGNTDEEFWFSENRETFWDNFSIEEKRIAEYIDNDEGSKLQKLMKEIFKGFIPVTFFFGAKNNSKYVLMTSAKEDMHIVLLLYSLFCSAPDDIKKRWEFYNYLPTDIFTYSQKRFRYNFEKRKMKYRIVPKDEPSGLELSVKFDGYDEMSENRQDILRLAIYFYLCSLIGEEKILNNILAVNVSDEGGEWVDEEHMLKLVALYSKDPVHFEGMVRSPISLEAKGNYSSWLPFKSNVKNVVTCYPDLMVRLLPKKVDEFFTAQGYGTKYAYIKLDYGILDALRRKKFDPVNFFVEINQNARKEFTSFIPIGYTMHDKSVCFDFLVLDGGKFFTFVSSLSPFLSGYKAKLVIVTDSSVTVCNCDRDLSNSD